MDKAIQVLRSARLYFSALPSRRSISRQLIHRSVAILAIFMIILTLFHFRDTTSPISISVSRKRQLPRDIAANATLGFEKILAVSLKESWRTRGLLSAAAHTGLSITIPEQPYNAKALIHAFGELGSSDESIKRPGLGSARAWLAHLDMIKYVVTSGLSSAFIVEDDVDWDVEIHSQMRILSDAVRNFTHTPEHDTMSPFGTAWDVLWLGHCGEMSDRERPKYTYFDPTRPKTDHYIGWSKKWLENVEAIVPPTHRAVQRTRNTVCSFAYGVTHAGARNILYQLGEGQDEAFDIGLMAKCRDGKLSCLTILPELMHHYEPRSDSGYVSPNNEANGKGTSVDEAEFEGIMGHTANIVKSARCDALWGKRCQDGNEG